VIRLDWCPQSLMPFDDIRIELAELAHSDHAFRKHVVARTLTASKSTPGCEGRWTQRARWARCRALQRIEQDIQREYIKAIYQRWPELAEQT
jgi:hypothetical protein